MKKLVNVLIVLIVSVLVFNHQYSRLIFGIKESGCDLEPVQLCIAFIFFWVWYTLGFSFGVLMAKLRFEEWLRDNVKVNTTTDLITVSIKRKGREEIED